MMPTSPVHYAAELRVREELAAAEARRQHPRRPRPPSRVRVALASRLVRLAARLADESVTAMARRVA